MNNKIRTVTGCILVLIVLSISTYTQNVFLLLASAPLLIGGYPWHRGDRLWTNFDDIFVGVLLSLCAIFAGIILSATTIVHGAYHCQEGILSGVLGLALLVLYGWRLKRT